MSSMRFVQNAPWPRDEVEKLRAWREAGIGNTEIAHRLGRTAVSVMAKARALKLPRMKPPPPPPPRQGKEREREPEVPRAGRTTLPPLPSLRQN